MFRRTKRPQRTIPHRGTLLRLEQLETRNMLTPLVDVRDDVVAGGLDLLGNNEPCHVEIRSINDSNGDDFVIRGVGDTKLTYDGGATLFDEIPMYDISDRILVDLGLTGNTLDFFERDNGAASNVPQNVVIENRGDNTINLGDIREVGVPISDVGPNLIINGDLTVTDTAGTNFDTLNIVRCKVEGDTIVDNVNGGSDTFIEDSELQGGGATPVGLQITNADGKDIIQVQGNSQFGMGGFPSGTWVVNIDNGNDGSRTTFTGNSIIYGDVQIANGGTLATAQDIVTFNNAEVLGGVFNDNGPGNSEVSVQSCDIGTDLTNGNPLTINNDEGYDTFTMTNANILWGLAIDNDVAAAGASTSGSSTHIQADCTIGTRSANLATPHAILDTALYISGDNGNDVVNVNGASDVRNLIDGEAILELFDGQNDVGILNTNMDSFHYNVLGITFNFGDETDNVFIGASTVAFAIDVWLGDGGDHFAVKSSASLPPSTGILNIDGGLGWDLWWQDDDVTPSSLSENNFDAEEDPVWPV